MHEKESIRMFAVLPGRLAAAPWRRASEVRMTAVRGIVTETAGEQPPQQDAGKEVVRCSMANTFNTLEFVGAIVVNELIGVLIPPFHGVLIGHAALLQPLDGVALSSPNGEHAVRA